jgi:hypothetical protein
LCVYCSFFLSFVLFLCLWTTVQTQDK